MATAVAGSQRSGDLPVAANDGSRPTVADATRHSGHRQKDEVCINFQFRRCRLGRSCHYKHVYLKDPTPHVSVPRPEAGLPPRPTWKSGEICRLFQRGLCLYGDICRHIHVLHQGELPTPSGATPTTDSVPSQREGSVLTQHTDSLPSQTPERSPIFSAQPHEHGDVVPPQSTQSVSASVESTDASRSATTVPQDGKNTSVATAVVQKRGLCREYSRRGICLKGKLCKYTHRTEGGATAVRSTDAMAPHFAKNASSSSQMAARAKVDLVSLPSAGTSTPSLKTTPAKDDPAARVASSVPSPSQPKATSSSPPTLAVCPATLSSAAKVASSKQSSDASVAPAEQKVVAPSAAPVDPVPPKARVLPSRVNSKKSSAPKAAKAGASTPPETSPSTVPPKTGVVPRVSSGDTSSLTATKHAQSREVPVAASSAAAPTRGSKKTVSASAKAKGKGPEPPADDACAPTSASPIVTSNPTFPAPSKSTSSGAPSTVPPKTAVVPKVSSGDTSSAAATKPAQPKEVLAATSSVEALTPRNKKAASAKAKGKSPVSPAGNASAPTSATPIASSIPLLAASSKKAPSGLPEMKEICRDFTKKGRCKRGVNCPYIHPSQAAGPDPAAVVTENSASTAASSSAAPRQPTKMTSSSKSSNGGEASDESIVSKSKAKLVAESEEPVDGQDVFERSLDRSKQGRGRKKKTRQKLSAAKASKVASSDNEARTASVEVVTVVADSVEDTITSAQVTANVSVPRPAEQTTHRNTSSRSTLATHSEFVQGSHGSPMEYATVPPTHVRQPSCEPDSSSSDATFYSSLSSLEGSPRSSNSSITQLPVTPREMCIDWFRGNCFRVNCRYSHKGTGYVSKREAVDECRLQDCFSPEHPQDPYLDHLTGALEFSKKLPRRIEKKPAYVVPPNLPQANERPVPLVPPGLGLEALIANGSRLPPRKAPEDAITIPVLDSTKVTYGPGFEIRQLLTGFESQQLFLGQVPCSVTPVAITAALEAYGEVLTVTMPDKSTDCPVMNVRVTFAKPKEAEHAASSLDGAQLFGTVVSARLTTFRSSVGKGVFHDRDVLLEIPVPYRTGFVGYETREQADKAIAMGNGFDMRGNCLSAVFHQRLPQVGTFNVRFIGLPPDAKESDLARFGVNEGVMMDRPNYLSLKRAIDSVIDLLQGFGDLVNVNVLPPPYKRGVARIWAHFSHAGVAENFCQALNGSRLPFIGKGKLFAKHYRTLSFLLPGDVYDVLSNEIVLLRSFTWDNDYGSSISVFDKRPLNGPSAPVQVKLVSVNIPALMRLKAAFEKLLRGEKIVQDGEIVWDGFFNRRVGSLYLENLERINPGVMINRDTRRRTISVFGDAPKRAAVRRMILTKVASLRAQRTHIFPLGGRLIGLFFGSDMAALQRQLGVENVFLDRQNRVLKVRGNEDAQKVAELSVVRARQRHGGERHRLDVECPVCFDDVTNPVTLPCGHMWCRSCLSNYLMAAVDNKVFPLTCLGDEAKCSLPIPLETAQDLLSPNDFDTVIHASFLSYVHSRPKEFHYCPTPDCPQVYRKAPRGTVLQCPSCLIRICGNCHVEYHEGAPCSIGDVEDQELFEKWKQGHDVKNCPGCSIPIERAAGCNHMTCARCKTHICWVCLETFSKSNEVYDHMRMIHGGIGL